jgi:predicted GIY-YIG superfamily endonuclease
MLKMAFKEQAMDRTQTFKSHAKFKNGLKMQKIQSIHQQSEQMTMLIKLMS